MTLYIDLDLLRIVEGLPYRRSVAGITVRRGDTPQFDVRFCRNGVVVDPGAISLFFVCKDTGKYDQNPPLVLVGPFGKTGVGSSAVWSAIAVFSTAAIDALLEIDGDDGNDLAKYVAMGEFSFQNGISTVSTDAIVVTIQNDLYRSGDTPPAQTIPTGFAVYLQGIVGTTGGGETKLDGVPTITTSVPAIVELIIAGEYQKWHLQNFAGQVEDGIGFVIPDDFHATTNPKVWVRIL